MERNFEEGQMTSPISGKEFRESGALWFVNSILHLFGMAITWNPETDELKAAAVKFRGFDENVNSSGYKNLTQYLKDNANELLTDCD